jgi:hypothetical protein
MEEYQMAKDEKVTAEQVVRDVAGDLGQTVASGNNAALITPTVSAPSPCGEG